MNARSLLARLRGLFAGPQADDDTRAEFEAHLEMETAENVRRGMMPEEARRQALLASGGFASALDAVRDQRGLPWLESAFADLRYAVRALRHAPVFTAIVVLTLALGIGANTAIFSVVRAVLLKPLPHRDGDHLVYLRHESDAPGSGRMAFSVPEVRDIRTGAPALAGGIAEWSQWTGILQREDGARRMSVGLVTGNYFDVMGLAPVLGRLTRPADDGPGVPAVMVLSHDFWVAQFGGDSSIVGRQVTVDNAPVTVIGVLQPAPFFPEQVDAILNMVVSPHHLSAFMVEGRTHRMTEMVARLAPGATLAQARSQVDAVDHRMQADHPEAYDTASHVRVSVVPFREALGDRARLTVWLLMAAAAFVMVIAAANVTNLTLMRGVRREHELVTRAALGAGVARLRRLLLAENLLLTLLGAALGVAIATGGVRLLTALAARYSPRAAEIRLDTVVLGFTLGLAVALALLLSFVATLPREGLFAVAIASGGHRVSTSFHKQRLQRGLVVAQVAVSVVLLAGAGLLTRTLLRLSRVDTGLTAEQVLTMQVPLLDPIQAMRDPSADQAAKAKYEQMRQEIAALPGVTAAGLGAPMPLREGGVFFDVKAEGRAAVSGEAQPNAELRTANPEFFAASGIPVVGGRAFDATDQAQSGKVVIVNQAFAERMFPGRDPVGQRMAFTGDVLRFTPISGDWRTIVGVVGNVRSGSLDAPPPMAVYLPFSQMVAFSAGLAIRTDGDAAALVPAATRIVRRLAPTVPIERLATIAQIRDESVSPRRLNAVLLGAFSLLAVIIAAVGIAGVLAFSVSTRTNEIGLRMSLGADSGRVQRMILKEGGELLALGLGCGVAGALFATRAIQGLLFDVAPRDPVTFTGVALLMAGVGTLACWIPALRASRIDPAITMRSAS